VVAGYDGASSEQGVRPSITKLLAELGHTSGKPLGLRALDGAKLASEAKGVPGLEPHGGRLTGAAIEAADLVISSVLRFARQLGVWLWLG
jgi:hypothetical protein